MAEIRVKYYDGKSSKFELAKLQTAAQIWIISFQDGEGFLQQKIWKVADINRESITFGENLTVKYGSFPYESIEIDSPKAIDYLQDSFPQIFSAKEISFFLRKGWSGLLAAIALSGGFIFLFYKYIIPEVAYAFAETLPKEYEEKIGESLLTSQNWLLEVDSTKSKALNQYAKNIDFNSNYRLRFYVSNEDIVNAYALPGGFVVVYQGLLNKMKTEEELAGLLAHEVIHINNKHTTKSMFKSLANYLFISIILSDINAVSNIIIENTNAVSNLSFSRSLEKEADLDGLEVLQRNRINPEGMILLMKRLKEEAPGLPSQMKFLSSHPLTEERIAYLKKEATKIDYQKSKDLKKEKREQIFHFLKQ